MIINNFLVSFILIYPSFTIFFLQPVENIFLIPCKLNLQFTNFVCLKNMKSC